MSLIPIVNLMDLPDNFLIDDLSLGIDRGLTRFDLEISFTSCPHILLCLQEVV